MSEYARDEDFPVRAMYYAKKTLVQKGILPRTCASYTTRFEQVQITEVSSESEWRIVLPSGAAVGFSTSLDEQTLSEVLKSATRV